MCMNKTISDMKHLFYILFIWTALFRSCVNGSPSSVYHLSGNSLDSILMEGGNHYDIASQLFRNPDFLSESPRSFRDGGRLTYETSSDGCFRVYTMELAGRYPEVENLIQYGDSKYDPLLLLDEMAFMGRVDKIGMKKDGKRTIYLPITFQYFCCSGEYISANICSYSSVKESYGGASVLSEPVLKTKNGTLLETIEVDWNDNCGEVSSCNVFCIELDSVDNTNEIYIQVVDADTGKALDKALVYRWDGTFYTYSGIIPKRIATTAE